MTDTAPPTAVPRLLRERPRPEWVRRRPGAHWLVVASVCIGAFMGQLDASIVTLAIPDLQADLGVSLAEAEWVALSYLLVLVAAVVPIGRVADAVGRKALYVYGFAVFTVASLACALAPSVVALDGARVVQGLGAAMLQANSVALIRLAMPAGMVGRGIGIQGVAQALGLALGPTIGGLLVALGGWRLVFLVNVPAGGVGIVTGILLLPRSRNLTPFRGFDTLGVLLLVPAVAGLLLLLTTAGHPDATGAAAAIAGAVGVVAAVALALHVRRVRARGGDPIVPVDLFASAAFTRGIVTGLASYLVLFGTLFVGPVYLEGPLGLSPGRAGLLLTALPAALAVTTPLAGRLADSRGVRLPATLGSLVVAAGLALTVLAAPTLLGMAAGLAVTGVGVGLFTPANNAGIMLAAPASRAGVAGGVLNMTRAWGTALGVAVTLLVYQLAGFTVAVLTLAAIALATAAVASRGPARAPQAA